MISRRCLVLVFVLGLPGTLCAQKQQGSWSDLRGLRVGQGIVVIESSMKRHDGAFISITDDVLTLQEKGSDVSVKREAVVRVSTASGARRGGLRGMAGLPCASWRSDQRRMPAIGGHCSMRCGCLAAPARLLARRPPEARTFCMAKTACLVPAAFRDRD